ncbi:AAA family ATPase [Gordonia sp. FQ]|uniref:AAA family ATPase n=1 Tax=Gordonia sp. FQ TaxID=3446634 RepID=UPI003F86BCC9
MTLTDNSAPGTGPIASLAGWFDTQSSTSRETLQALGELLTGLSASTAGRDEDADAFTARCLGADHASSLVKETLTPDAIQRVTCGVAVAEWIAVHPCETGPAEFRDPPSWTYAQIGDDKARIPSALRVHFAAGTVTDVDVIIHIVTSPNSSLSGGPEIAVCALAENQEHAVTLLERIVARAGELNPFRGRALRASYNRSGANLVVLDLPRTLTRDTVIVPDTVWAEIDLGIASVRDQHELLNNHGLGSRRGVLLCGPPGTGKSAVSAAIAAELVGDFTVIYVDARAGSHLLTEIVEIAHHLGGPVLLIMEDIDLWIGRRRTGETSLSELLQAMDIAPDARILTLASTNDAAALDAAAIRTGRFDAIVEVDYPSTEAAAHILTVLTSGIPGGDRINTRAVANALPAKTSGSDLREIVRRTVLASPDATITTAALLAELGGGRYHATAPAGMYL